MLPRIWVTGELDPNRQNSGTGMFSVLKKAEKMFTERAEESCLAGRTLELALNDRMDGDKDMVPLRLVPRTLRMYLSFEQLWRLEGVAKQIYIPNSRSFSSSSRYHTLWPLRLLQRYSSIPVVDFRLIDGFCAQ